MISFKKVTFNEKNNKIHHMITWSFAYRNARKSDWQILALDGYRFKNRINIISKNLDPILENEHRDRIYNERFRGF